MTISLRHIEVFWAIMTSGSVTAAATLLKTSQPTVSRELARLEHLTGLQLFERSKGKLRPTAQALSLFEEVQRSYQGLERIAAKANALRHNELGQLSIACLPAFSLSLLPLACRLFRQECPQVSIDILPQESPILEEWLSAQRCDIGLTEHHHQPLGTLIEHLFTADEVCVLPSGHTLCNKSAISPADFHQQPFISLSATDIYRQQVDSLFQQHEIERDLIMETHSAASVCAMVKQGLGLAIVNPLTALDYQGAGLVIRPLTSSIPFHVYLVVPQHRPQSTLVSIFIQQLKYALQHITGQLNSIKT